jgi:hypothetical protein
MSAYLKLGNLLIKKENVMLLKKLIPILIIMIFLSLHTIALASETNLLSDISDQELLEDTILTIPFSITRNNTILEIKSHQQDIIPNDSFHIKLAQTGIDYTLTLIPVHHAFGTAEISIFATDAQDISETHSFKVQVAPVNDPPNFAFDQSEIVINEDFGLYKISNWASIDPGPDNEFDQDLSIMISIDHPELFSITPNLSQFGELRFETAPDAFGEAIVSIKIRDTGGTENDGKNQVEDQIHIMINPVNDPPTFQKGEDIVVKEDSGFFKQAAWATNISSGPNENQTCQFYINVTNGNLFSFAPYINPEGKLTFQPKTDTFGETLVIVNLRETSGLSTRETFNITIAPVNDPPSFLKGEDISVLSTDGPQEYVNWATDLDPGVNESEQVIQFNCEVDNPSLFTQIPYVDESGTLTFLPNPAANGIAAINIEAVDSGGISDGGIDTSEKQNFTISVTYFSEIAFTIGPDIIVSEDADMQIITKWVTDITPQPNNNISNIHFSTRTDESDLFSIPPEITPDGTLQFKPASNAFGRASVETMLIVEMADAMTLTSPMQPFAITITSVNDAPSITVDTITPIVEDAGHQSITLITSCTPGPANESEQSCDYFILSDPSEMFAIQPSILTNGVLQFLPADNVYGTYSLNIVAQDNAGDSSTVVTRQIVIKPVNDPPAFVCGSDIVINSLSGWQQYTAWINQISAGPNESEQSIQFEYSVDKPELFEIQPEFDASGTLTFSPKSTASGTAHIDVWAVDSGESINGGSNTSEKHNFAITVHYSPEISFQAGSDIVVSEDAPAQVINSWATNIYPQPNDAIESMYFSVNTASELFRNGPVISLDGSLTFQPKTNAFGSASVEVTLIVVKSDSTKLTSDTKTFNITIQPVNDPPSLTVADMPPILEDAGKQSIQLISSCTPGPPNEAEQSCHYLVETDNNDLFASLPQIQTDGVLTFLPADNAYGNANLSITAYDDEGASSPVLSRQIVISPVNDCPDFTPGDDQEIYNVSGIQTVYNWATDITSGPLESLEEFIFNVSCDNPDLFSEQPQIDNQGTLQYTPAPGQYGSSVVHVYVQDNGGIDNGGCDKSSTHDFEIRIIPIKSLTVLIEGYGHVMVNDFYEVIDEWTHEFAMSDEVALAPHSLTGWSFSHWTGDISSEQSEIGIVMDESKTVTAHFMPISASVALQIQGDGWVQVNDDLYELPLEKYIQTGDWVSITALPQNRFLTWHGDYQGYTNPIDIQMNHKFDLSAQFIDTKEWLLNIWLESDTHNETPNTAIGVANEADQAYYLVSGQYPSAIYVLDPDTFDRFSKDVQAMDGSIQKYQWIIAVNPKGNMGDPMREETVTVRWHPYQLSTTGVYTIQRGFDSDSEILVSDMRDDCSFSVTGVSSDQYFTLTWIPFNAFHTFEMVKGWNLISLPLIPENNTLNSLFPDADVAYGFNDGEYVRSSILEPGKGYWVNMPVPATYTVFGDVFSFEEINLDTGWHLIGSIQDESIPVPEKEVIEVMYQYLDGAYIRSHSIEPGMGYWIRLTEPSSLAVLPE